MLDITHFEEWHLKNCPEPDRCFGSLLCLWGADRGERFKGKECLEVYEEEMKKESEKAK